MRDSLLCRPTRPRSPSYPPPHSTLPLPSAWALALVFAAVLVFPPCNAEAASAAADDIVLIEGATYRARLKLGFLQCLASRDRIGRKLGKSGFSGVRVFMSARELPPDWPPAFRSRAGGCERYAEGVWARPTLPRRRPSSIESWWVARPAPQAP
jgi:hypothetical protein